MDLHTDFSSVRVIVACIVRPDLLISESCVCIHSLTICVELHTLRGCVTSTRALQYMLWMLHYWLGRGQSVYLHPPAGGLLSATDDDTKHTETH